MGIEYLIVTLAAAFAGIGTGCFSDRTLYQKRF